MNKDCSSVWLNTNKVICFDWAILSGGSYSTLLEDETKMQLLRDENMLVLRLMWSAWLSKRKPARNYLTSILEIVDNK